MDAGEIQVIMRMIDQLSGPTREMLRAIDDVEREVKQAGQAADAADTEFREAARSIDDVGKQAQGAGSKVASFGVEMAKGVAMGVGFKALDTVMLGISSAIDFVGGSVIGLNARLEMAAVGFETLLGSGEAAKVFLDDLAALAQSSPFGFEELQIGAQRFLGVEMAAADTLPTLENIGNVIAGYGKGTEELDRVTLALGQMLGKGKAQAEDMMQIVEAGIPVWQLVADNLDMTVGEVQRLASEGKISAQTVIDAFNEVGSTRFADAMAQQAATFEGAMGIIQESLAMAVADGGKPFFEMVSEGAQELGKFVSSDQFADWAERVAERLEEAAEAVRQFVTDHKDELRDMAESGVELAESLEELAGVVREMSSDGDGLADVATAFDLITVSIGLTADAVGILVDAWNKLPEPLQAAIEKGVELASVTATMGSGLGSAALMAFDFVKSVEEVNVKAEETAAVIDQAIDANDRYARATGGATVATQEATAAAEEAAPALEEVERKYRSTAEAIVGMTLATLEADLEWSNLHSTAGQLPGVLAEIESATRDVEEASYDLSDAQRDLNSVTNDVDAALEALADRQERGIKLTDAQIRFVLAARDAQDELRFANEELVIAQGMAALGMGTLTSATGIATGAMNTAIGSAAGLWSALYELTKDPWILSVIMQFEMGQQGNFGNAAGMGDETFPGGPANAAPAGPSPAEAGRQAAEEFLEGLGSAGGGGSSGGGGGGGGGAGGGSTAEAAYEIAFRTGSNFVDGFIQAVQTGTADVAAVVQQALAGAFGDTGPILNDLVDAFHEIQEQIALDRLLGEDTSGLEAQLAIIEQLLAEWAAQTGHDVGDILSGAFEEAVITLWPAIIGDGIESMVHDNEDTIREAGDDAAKLWLEGWENRFDESPVGPFPGRTEPGSQDPVLNPDDRIVLPGTGSFGDGGPFPQGAVFEELLAIFSTMPELADDMIDDVLAAVNEGRLTFEQAMQLFAMIPGEQFNDAVSDLREIWSKGLSDALLDGDTAAAASFRALLELLDQLGVAFEDTATIGTAAFDELMGAIAASPEQAGQFVDDILKAVQEGQLSFEQAMQLMAQIPGDVLGDAIAELAEAWQVDLIEALLAGNDELAASLRELLELLGMIEEDAKHAKHAGMAVQVATEGGYDPGHGPSREERLYQRSMAGGGMTTGEGLVYMHANEHVTPEESIPMLAGAIVEAARSGGGGLGGGTVVVPISIGDRHIETIIIETLDGTVRREF